MRMVRTAVLVTLAWTRVAESQTLTSAARPSREGDVTVKVFADGAVRAAVAGQGEGSTASAGSIGVSIVDRRSVFTSQISVATGNDTLRKGFGTSLLVPASGGRLAAGLIDYRRSDLIGDRERSLLRFIRGWGVHTYVSASSATWSTLDSANPDETIGVAVMGVGLSGFREIFNQPLGDDGNSVSVLIDAGFAWRALYGDIANSEPGIKSIKLRTLGTTKEHFPGYEIGLTIQVNDVRAGLSFFSFPNVDAPGFSDGQLVAAFSLQGSLLSWTGKKER